VRSSSGSETNRGAVPPVLAAAETANIFSGSIESPAAGISHVPGVTARVKLVELARGLYGISIGETRGARRELAGTAMPATHIIPLPVDGITAVDVLPATAGPAGWLGPEGGTVALRIPCDRGHVLITTYRPDDQEVVPLEIQITRIDFPVRMPPTHVPPQPTAADSAEPPAPRVQARDIKIEVVLHIERMGDRRFAGGEWIGSRGEKRRIEAFSVRPLEELAPTEVEYKAYGPNGRQTPWVTGAKLCGTRGRRIPLTGFAIRLAASLRERFDIVYQGAYFDSGLTDARRNGEPCIPSRVDDSLEAVNIRLIERTGV
jgi:hypothetical protein